MKKRVLAAIFAGIFAMSLMAGCGKEQAKEEMSEETQDVDEEENYETGDASLDNPRNQDGIGEKELLVVSFGTSYNDNRRLTIGAIENYLENAFGDEYSIRRGFTSQIIIDHVKSRDKVTIDNVEEALQRAMENGVKTLVVQPTHLMNGIEYQELTDTVAKYADGFEKISIGEPLLMSERDFELVCEAMVEDTKSYDDGETAIVFMGHGTEAQSNEVYAKMQNLFVSKGYENYYVGTVEAAPTLEDVQEQMKGKNYKRVVLQPMMIVAGDHANNDMAGAEEDSWKSILEKEGFTVICNLKGMGEMPKIQELIKEHAQAAIEKVEE